MVVVQLKGESHLLRRVLIWKEEEEEGVLREGVVNQGVPQQEMGRWVVQRARRKGVRRWVML